MVGSLNSRRHERILSEREKRLIHNTVSGIDGTVLPGEGEGSVF
jgi:hypothetical protein